MLARKCVRQRYAPSRRIRALMVDFNSMVNDCIQAGILNDCSTLRRLSKLTYGELRKYQVPSYYRLCAISKAAGILASRKKSISRGVPTKNPYMASPNLVSCYGFLITDDGKLRIPIDNRVYEEIELNRHTLEQIWKEGVKVNSFSLSGDSLSLCITKNVVDAAPFRGAAGVDGNPKGLLVAAKQGMVHYDLSKALRIRKTSSEIISSFRRRDERIRRKITEKYTRRRVNRTATLLHSVSRNVIENAKREGQVIVFAESQGSGAKRSGYMNKWTNAWQFGEVRRQIEYKARWNGIVVLRLRRSQLDRDIACPACGERLPRQRDGGQSNAVCQRCGSRIENSFLRALQLSESGWVRFAQSLPHLVVKGGAGEAMVEEGGRRPPVLRVDASKLAGSVPAGRTEIMHGRGARPA